MSSQDEESAIVDEDADSMAAGGNAQYSPQDVRSGLSKKNAQQSESTEAVQMGSPKSDKPKNQQKSPTKKAKGKNKRGTPAEKATSTEDSTKAAGKAEVDGSAPIAVGGVTVVEGASANKENVATVPSEGLQGTASAQIPEADDSAKATTSDAATKTQEPVAISEASPTIVESPVANELESPAKTASVVEPAAEEAKNQEDGTAAPKDPSPAPADDTVSDDEAKHDASFHSAQEVQTPQPEAREGPLVPEHGTTTPPKHLTKTCSQFADNSDAPVAVVEPQVSQFPVPLDDSDAATAGATAELIPTDKPEPAQEIAVNHTVTSSASNDTSMDTPTEASRAEAAKKNDAQVQSLHPFAKKQMSQTKKDNQAKKKQQKKEKQEAERIAKAKAEQREKEEADRKAQAAKPAVPGDSAAASMKPASTNQANGGQATPGSKKSKVKAKAKAPIAGTARTAEQEKKGEDNDTGKLTGGNNTDASKETDSVTQKVDVVETSKVELTDQACSAGSSVIDLKAIASPSPPEPAVAPGALAPPKKAPTQEVNHHHNHLSQDPPTYAQGSPGPGLEVDSNQSSIPPSSVAAISQALEHSKL
jgi:hypothetical protein